MAKKKIPVVLTPCPPSKQCPICYSRMAHSEKFYGKAEPVEAVTDVFAEVNAKFKVVQ
jgi:hypothetical protein